MENEIETILNFEKRSIEERVDLSLLTYISSKPTDVKHLDFYKNLISLEDRGLLILKNVSDGKRDNFDAAISVFDIYSGKEKLMYTKVTSSGKEYLSNLKKPN